MDNKFEIILQKTNSIHFPNFQKKLFLVSLDKSVLKAILLNGLARKDERHSPMSGYQREELSDNDVRTRQNFSVNHENFVLGYNFNLINYLNNMVHIQ